MKDDMTGDGPWEHLKAYGYAPGGYMNTCHICKEMKTDLDKRAFTCRACAEKRFVEGQVLAHLSERAMARTSHENIRDVLEALEAIRKETL